MTVTSSNPQGTDTEFGYGQLFGVLLRRRFWFLGVFCGIVAMAIPLSLTKEPTYESSMELLIEPYFKEATKNRQPGFEDQVKESNLELDYATQLNLMRSNQLLQKAVDLLLPQYPTLEVEMLKESLSVIRKEEGEYETKIVEVDYTSNDPVQTQDVLIAIQQVYQEFNLQQQEQRIAEGLAFINNQLPTARESVNQAEQALEQFRQSQNLIDPVEQATTVTQMLNTIEQERETIRAQYQETQARYQALQQQLERSPQKALTSSRLSESSRYQTLLDELQKTELALAEQRVRFTDADPTVQQLLQKRQRQQALLQAEANRVLGQTSPDTVGNLQQAGQLGETDLTLSRQLAETQTSLEALEAKDKSLAQTQQQLQAQLSRFPQLIAKYERLQPEVQVERNTLQKLLEARQELGIEIARGGFKWQVVEAPQLGEQTGPKTKQDVLLAMVIGLFLGGIAAFGREALDDAVHTSDQLKQRVALPLLGILPQLPHLSTNGKLIHFPFSKSSTAESKTLPLLQSLPLRESLDLIYKNIQLLNADGKLKSLVITSTLPGEGKSTFVLGLALSAARLHQRVLLIDADLRRPTLHQQLHLSNDQGMATILANDTKEVVPQQLSLFGAEIDILTAGPIPADPVQLLSCPRMKQLIAQFEQGYDLVLLDTPPILGIVDAMQVASFCQGVILVARLDRVTQSELTEATNLLAPLNAIGVVANGASRYANPYVAYTKHKKSQLLELN
ncbi:GumC family protein [Coleofasciculus sp. F4-SAH-05]|uniref:GumC family protein n=1 Tax=Coleofasciculus sp. F4-SAH-05 TaxID=3069525 RepID=UPI0032FED333